MGKAYSSDERSDIKVRIMDAALELYHENGAKTLNIREIVKRAGISLGSFYNFWPDKNSLILDVMKYRASQKLAAVTPLFKGSAGDPVGFLASQICSWCFDMKDKYNTRPLYRESISFLLSSSNDNTGGFYALYSQFLNDLSDYWISEGAIESFDKDGVTSVIISVAILLSGSERIDNKYFETIVEDLVFTGLSHYIRIKEN